MMNPNPIRDLNNFFSDESKWCKNYLQKGTAFCVLGGIREVIGPSNRIPCFLGDLLLLEQEQKDIYSAFELVAFNNKESTTFKDFKDFLTKAEVLWDEKYNIERTRHLNVSEKVLEPAE